MSSIQSCEFTETGRRLGHDLFRYRKGPLASSPQRRLSASIREGFDEAAARGLRCEPPDRFVRKWLQLRLGAYRRGRAFDENITPRLLRAMDVAECPVLRIALTHGEQKPSDWSIDRLNNDGAYAANNLAVMSTQANLAKGARSFDEVRALAECGHPTDGLQPIEWLRLAALMLGPCFALRPRLAPVLPLIAPIPAYSVRLAMQQVQHVFTQMARTQAGKNALVKHFKCAAPDERALTRLRALAEAVHTGRKGLAHEGDVWLQAGVMNALQRWRDALDDDAWAVAGEVSRCLAGACRVAPARLQSWRLETRGYVSWAACVDLIGLIYVS